MRQASVGGDVSEGQAGYVDIALAFTGRYFDADTGLQNNLHRWYDPSVGRWLSEDPIGFAGGDANLYRYVRNSSTMYVDPRGLFGGPIDIDLINDAEKARQRRERGRRLTDGEKKALAPFFDDRDLNNARLHFGRMPWYTPEWADGITRGDDIYFRDPDQAFSIPTSWHFSVTRCSMSNSTEKG